MIRNTPDQQLCDDEKLIAVLNDGDQSAEHQEVIEHIEQCPRCQKRFDELAAQAQDWTKVRQALLNGDPYSGNGVGSATWLDSLRNEVPIAWTESMASQLLSPASHPELLGRLGRYDIERLIGSGGMGVVFKAHDSELNRPVAIKILAPYLSSSGPARKRFAREARAAAAVVHEHVVPIYNVETERETPFLVMHYIAGESLQGRIDREGALELCEILRIGMQVASGLSAAHQQGLVHRDIKPSNILMEQGVERALITDFGLARAADDASLTRTGFHPGTPQYMSPEQASGEHIDARSDLFSLGSVLYTMCTGRPPFRAETSLGVLRRITDVDPRSIREINSSIPEWLCLLIARLMSKSRDERFANAMEVADLLEQCLAHVQQPTSGLPASLIPQPACRRSVFNSSRTGVIAMLGTIGFALLGMVLWQATEAPDISGQWTDDEWGTVVLETKGIGEYEGTFTGVEKTDSDAGDSTYLGKIQSLSGFSNGGQGTTSGTLKLRWSRVERRFNGTWGKGADRRGAMSLRMVNNEIRGGWTTDESIQLGSSTPLLGDLLWKRMVNGGATKAAQNIPEKEADELESSPHQKYKTKPTDTLGIPKRVLSVSQVLKEGRRLEVSQEVVGVQFQVAHAQPLYPAPYAEKEHEWLLSSEKPPYDLGPGVFRVYILASALDELRKKGIEDIAKHFVGKVFEFEGRVHAIELADNPKFRPNNLAYCIDVKDLNQIREAEPDTQSASDGVASIGDRAALPKNVDSKSPDDAASNLSSEWEVKQVFNPAHDQMIWAVAFSPDGKTIASAGADKLVKIWDVESGSLLSTSIRPVNCTDVTYSRNGLYMAIAGGNDGENPSGELVLLETADSGEEFVLESHEKSRYVKSVAFSPDSKWLASGGSDTTVKIWDVEQRELHAILTDHTELVHQVAFSPDGKILASASFDHTIKLWSVPEGDEIATLRGHRREVRGIAFSPDSTMLVSVGDDGTARLWSVVSDDYFGESLGIMRGDGDPILSVEFSPEGQYFATASRGPSALTFWDVNTLTPIVVPQQKREAMSLAFSPDGQMLAIAGAWNRFQIWNRKATKARTSEKETAVDGGLNNAP